MRYLLFASHGRLAEGMLHSVEMITGTQPNVWTLCAYLDEQVDIRTQMKEVLQKLGEEDELIVVTDIFGGSVNNEFMNLLNDHRIHVISGLNLPMAIELVTAINTNKTAVDLINAVVLNSKGSIKYCNQELSSKTKDDDF